MLQKKYPGFVTQSILLEGNCPAHVTRSTFVTNVAVNEPLREFVVLFSTSFKFTLQTEANCFFFLSRGAVNIKNKSESPTETSFYFLFFFFFKEEHLVNQDKHVRLGS